MFERFPQPSTEMRNPFIVLRFVLFAILVYVNVLTLGFAAWNITVIKSLGADVLGAPTFVVVNSCFLIFILAGCLVASWFSSTPFDKVRIECAWTAVMSTLLLASSFDITVNGPPALCQGISVTACASSSLVVALSWISCMIMLLYSFSLLTTAVTHMSVIPDVWTTSVVAVPWFVHPSDPLAPRSQRVREKVPDFDVVDIKRMSFQYRTPIYAQHTKSLPMSPRTPPAETVLAHPRFPSTPASPVWHPRLATPVAESPAPSSPASPQPSPVAAPEPSPEPVPSPMERRTTWTSRLAALPHKPSMESIRPTWAKRAAPARRGVDQPFAAPAATRVAAALPRFSFSLKPGTVLPPVRPLRPLKLKSTWSQSTAASPPPIPKVPAKARRAPRANPKLSLDLSQSPTSTFYIDLERDAVVPVGPAVRPISYEMFPEDVVDPDQPVTRSVRSQWVRADSDTSSVTR